ncbi:MAG TPA: hypothetical protein VF026_22795 [Ktedonobacteraceae bacterium]
MDGVREVLGVIAQRLDREAKIAFLRGTADGEGVPLPLGAPPEVHEHELPSDKRQGSGRGSKHDLERSRVQPSDRLDRIVVAPPPREEAEKQLPVNICRGPNCRHRHVPPQQDRRAPQDGVHQCTVDQPGHDEQASQPMQREPALVLHEPALHIGGEAAHDRGQSWSERPQQ